MKTSNDGSLVSFLIAAYNEEQYIIDCIDSCLNQTYPHIQVCVTDDGSTDGTWKILQKTYKDNVRVALDRFEHNKGKVFAFNNSYSNASGRYFALIGADDVAFKDRIDASFRLLKNSQCDAVVGKRLFCDEKLNALNIDDKKIAPRNIHLDRLLFSNFCYGTALFFNHKIAQRCFPIPEILLFEDWWIGFNSLMYGKIAFLDKYVTKYRQHGANDVSDIQGRRIIEQKKKNFSRHSRYYLCFYNEIQKNKSLPNKKQYIKLILLNYYYRKLVLEDRLKNRIKYLPKIIKFAAFNLAFFLSIPLLVFGNRIFNLKKMQIFKHFF
jgi:glycosyltransferase involved in cell wall biosynthesis